MGIRLLILLLVFSSGRLMAQQPFFQWVPLEHRDTPPSVQALLQDVRGTIWAATTSGVCQLDGTSITHFDRIDRDQLPAATALGTDSLGQVWVGHADGRLSIIADGAIRWFRAPEGDGTAPVSDILFDEEGKLWYSTRGDGVYYFENDRLYRLDEEDGLPDLFVYDMLIDRLGRIWTATDRGVAIFDHRTSGRTIQVLNYSNGLPDNIIKKLRMDEHGVMWMASEDNGIFRWLTDGSQTQAVDGLGTDVAGTTDFIFTGNEIWLSAQRTGLSILDRDTQATRLESRDLAINTFLKDMEGNLWLGTKKGLCRTSGAVVEFVQPDGMPSSTTLAIAEVSPHELWFATSQGLFSRVIDPTGRVITKRELAQKPFHSFSVISLHAKAGYVWAGFYGEGVARINEQTREILWLRKELRNGSVLHITDGGGQIWLSTLGGAVRIEQPETKPICFNLSRSDGLSTDYIYQTFVDTQGKVWFATDRQGIDSWNGTTMEHLAPQLRPKAIYGFAEDNKHRVWANVQDHGLFQVTGDSVAVPALLSEHTNFTSLSSDYMGRLVLTSKDGIFLWDTEQPIPRHLNDAIGWSGREVTLNAVATGLAGRIWLGADQGIVRLLPEQSGVLQQPLGNVSFVSSFDRKVNYSGQRELKYDDNNLMFGLAGIWFQDPQSLVFQYRLDDLDRDWITTRDRSVVYSKLPPGEYRFSMRVSAAGDFSASTVTSHSFTIHPPFWRTNVFYGLVVATFGFLVYTVISARERKLLRDKRELERRVKQRTLEIQKKNEEIQAQAEEIKSMNDNLEALVHRRTMELEQKNKALEEYAFINAHNLRAPVASLLGLINLVEKLDLNSDNRVIVDHMKESAERLDAVVKSITVAIERGDTAKANDP